MINNLIQYKRIKACVNKRKKWHNHISAIKKILYISLELYNPTRWYNVTNLASLLSLWFILEYFSIRLVNNLGKSHVYGYSKIKEPHEYRYTRVQELYEYKYFKMKELYGYRYPIVKKLDSNI